MCFMPSTSGSRNLIIKRDSADDLSVANYTKLLNRAYVEHLFTDFFSSIEVHAHFSIKLSRSDTDTFLTAPTSHMI